MTPLIFNSNVTSLSKNTKVTNYPLIISIANIFYKNRHLNEGHCLLAILPKIIPVICNNYIKRLELFHVYLNHVFDPFKAASKE